MASRPVESITKIEVGTPSASIQAWPQAFDVHFHNIVSLTELGNTVLKFANFTYAGYPYGIALMVSDDVLPMIVVVRYGDTSLGDVHIEGDLYSLCAQGNSKKIKCRPLTEDKREVLTASLNLERFGQSVGDNSVKHVKLVFMRENGDMRNLVTSEGTLILRLFVRKSTQSPIDSYETPFIPKNPFSMNNFCMNEETSDVSFKVGDEVVYAHRLILRSCAPTLAELCEDALQVELTEITPWTLRQIMKYIYGGHVEWPITAEEEGRILEILKASDRYNITMLKVEGEARYVRKVKLTLETFAENYHLADSLKLPMLKEMVMKFMVDDSANILSSGNSIQSENMMRDILTAVAAKEQAARDAISAGRSGGEHLKLLPVDTLRRKLDAKGRGIDGTREMLITALERG